MFLAPAGNPSSLRFGHPDVATEHTGLSPCPFSSPFPVVRGRVRIVRPGMNRGLLGLGRVYAEAGGNTGVRYRRQLAKNERWVEGIAVTPYGRSRRLPEGSRQEGFSTTMRARTAQLYLPEATSGCPSSARAGAPVGTRAYTAFRLTRRDNSPCAGRKIVYNTAARRAVCSA